MRLLSGLLISLLLGFGLSANAGERPADWPPPQSGVSDCKDLVGMYSDPDEIRCERAEINGMRSGCTRNAAWSAFLYDYRSPYVTAGSSVHRTFSIDFEPDNTFRVTFFLNGQEAGARRFSADKWVCGSEGVTVETLAKKGQVFDKLPNKGTSTEVANVYRVGNKLYVKTTRVVKARFLHIIPTGNTSTIWYRFPSRTESTSPNSHP